MILENYCNIKYVNSINLEKDMILSKNELFMFFIVVTKK